MGVLGNDDYQRACGRRETPLQGTDSFGLLPFIFELTDPSGGPPQQASVVVSLADQWLRWPEATDPRYAAREIRPLVAALGSEGLVTVEE